MSRGRTGLIKAIKEVGVHLEVLDLHLGCCRRCSLLPPAHSVTLAHPAICRPSATQVFREVKFFGDAEITTLKKELEAHKLQLEQLKAQRAEMARREEQLVGAACCRGLRPTIGGGPGARHRRAHRAEHWLERASVEVHRALALKTTPGKSRLQ